MKNILQLTIFFACFLQTTILFSQAKNIAQRLGYEKDAKLLIIHADDIGMAHSVNSATIKAFEKSGINSASIMVPCPWFPEIATYAKENPQLDFGLHLTVNSEWKNYRWDGVLPATEIPSLLDTNGFLHSTGEELLKNANAKEIEKELDAQVQRAIAFGINPTHLDSHMWVLFSKKDFFQAYLNVAEKYRLPVFIPEYAANIFPDLLDKTNGKQLVMKNIIALDKFIPTEKWQEYYLDRIKTIPPGLNELIVHLAYDDIEMQAATIDYKDFGAVWRQNDLNMVLGEEFQDAIKNNNIKLVTWREINSVLQENK